MTGKERFNAAYNGQTVDRLPIYYGAQPEVTKKLCEHFNVNSKFELQLKLGIDAMNFFSDYVGPKYEHSAWINENPPELLDSLRKGRDDALEKYHFPEDWWHDGKTILPKIQPVLKKNKAVILGDEALGSITTMTGTWFGWEPLLTLMYDKPDFIHRLLGKICDWAIQIAEPVLHHAAKYADALWFGDDMGTQLGLLISPQLWRQFCAPHYKRLIDLAHKYDLPVMVHSCGAISQIIPDMIDIGVDILHPIQISAKGMAPEELADKFGDKLMFAGGVDTQHILPEGSPDDVRELIDRLKATLGRHNRYCIAPSQELDVDIPLENIIAMYEYIGC